MEQVHNRLLLLLLLLLVMSMIMTNQLMVTPVQVVALLLLVHGHTIQLRVWWQVIMDQQSFALVGISGNLVKVETLVRLYGRCTQSAHL